jgi:hypothetical protein
MRKYDFRQALFCSFVFLFICPQVGWAAEEDRFSITPRVWFTNMDTNSFDNGKSSTGHSSQSLFRIPLQGATITYAPKKTPGIDFLVTTLYGTGKTNFVDALEFGNSDLTRLDAEFLVRKDLKDTTMKAIAGFRHIKYTVQQRLTSGGTFSSTGTRNKESYVSMYLGELGLSGFNNITSNGRHRMFWSSVGGLGYSDFNKPNRLDGQGSRGKQSMLWTLDINAGYSYTISKNFGANARYRYFMWPLSATDPSDAPTGFLIVHGPELGLTYNF